MLRRFASRLRMTWFINQDDVVHKMEANPTPPSPPGQAKTVSKASHGVACIQHYRAKALDETIHERNPGALMPMNKNPGTQNLEPSYF